MNTASFWLGISLLILIIELLSNTFYLLLISLSMLVGSVVAMFSPNLFLQIFFCQLTIFFCLFACRKKFSKREKTVDQIFPVEIGQFLTINNWSQEGLSSVCYRGTTWQVELYQFQKHQKKDGLFTIVGINGNRLIVTPCIEPQIFIKNDTEKK